MIKEERDDFEAELDDEDLDDDDDEVEVDDDIDIDEVLDDGLDDDEDETDVDLVAEDDGDEDDDAVVTAGGDEDDDGETSLDELLDERATHPTDDEVDAEDIMALASEREVPIEPIVVRAEPLRDQQEFVCKSCYLVKPKVQLADPEKMYCRDCV